MSWISNIIGGAGGTLQSHGYAHNIKKQNDFYRNLFSPENINQLAYRFDPAIWDAIAGKYGTNGTGFQKDLYSIAQGRDISPYVLNRPVNMLNQQSGQNLARFQSLVGRNNAGGGLANSYGLANLAGRNSALADLYNKYGQWREQQRRSDINWILGQQAQSQQLGFNAASAYGNKWQVKPNWLEHLGNSLNAGAAAGGGTAKPTWAQTSTPTGYVGAGGQDYTGGQGGFDVTNGGNFYTPPDYTGYGGGGGSTVNVNTSNPYGGMSTIQTDSNTPNWLQQQYYPGINGQSNYGYN